MSGVTLQGVDSWSAVIQLMAEGRPSGIALLKVPRSFFDFMVLLHLSELPEGVSSDCVCVYVTKASLTTTEPRFRRKVTACN